MSIFQTLSAFSSRTVQRTERCQKQQCKKTKRTKVTCCIVCKTIHNDYTFYLPSKNVPKLCSVYCLVYCTLKMYRIL